MARPQQVMDLLQFVEDWTERAPSVSPQDKQELLAQLHHISVELYCQTRPQPAVPRPLRNPDDEAPGTLLDQVIRLLRAGVKTVPDQAITRACRVIRRKIEHLPEAQPGQRRREPALRAGAIIGAHRPTADGPTARERLRADQDQDPWDD